MKYGKKVLILGSTGRFGRHCVQAFTKCGWDVSVFHRDTDDLDTAAQEKDVIVNGWNPMYHEWSRSLPRLDQIIQHAALANGSTVLLPGNIYGYGVKFMGTLTSETPQKAENPLGMARIAQEKSYKVSGVKTLILRSGDYWDTLPSGNWLDRIILSKLSKGVMLYPGDYDKKHSWAYLPDLAGVAENIAWRADEFGTFEEILFPGFTLTAEEIRAQLSKIAGQHIKLRKMSWLPIHVAKPFWPVAKHLIEMRYLWENAHQIDKTVFETQFSNIPLSDPNTALKSVVQCLRHLKHA